MRKHQDLQLAVLVVIAGVALLATPSAAQEAKPAAAPEAKPTVQVSGPVTGPKLKPVVTYKLDFTLNELEDSTRVNSRSYSLLLEEETWGRTRIGTRVPLSMGEGKGVQYMDVGFSLDARINQREGGDLRLELRLEVNTFVPVEGEASRPREPVLRSMRSELAASIVPGKATLLTTVDELGSRRRFQVEVTATRVR